MKSDKNLLHIDADLRTLVLDVIRVLSRRGAVNKLQRRARTLLVSYPRMHRGTSRPPVLSRDVVLSRAEEGVRAKVDAAEWNFSRSEVAWVLNRSRGLMQMGDDGKAQISWGLRNGELGTMRRRIDANSCMRYPTATKARTNKR